MAYAFLSRGTFQPRRKRAIAVLAEIDRPAAELVRRWVTQQGAEALATVEALVRRVLGLDTFFDGISDRDPPDGHAST